MDREEFAVGSTGSGTGHAPMGSRGTAERGSGNAVPTSSPLVFSEVAEMELPVNY